MDSFFYEHPYDPVGLSDLEQDAELVLHLAIFFKTTQEPYDGIWTGHSMLATLRNTCHALDALTLLDLGVLDADLEESAATWLINLPGLEDIASEDVDQIRLYPSRFKTLINLGCFDNKHVRNDFDELHTCLSEDGLVLGVMHRAVLATLVYLDCLDMLAQKGLLKECWKWGRKQALEAVSSEVRLWYQDQKNATNRSQIRDLGDLSYAVDLLLRDNRLDTETSMALVAKLAMQNEIDQRDRTAPITSDILYCAIQLSRHFSDELEIRTALQSLIHEIKVRYQETNLDREADFIHALVLRLMLAYRGELLSSEITRRLITQQEQFLVSQKQSEALREREQFANLVRNKLNVKIEGIEPLTGGITEAGVFRVSFSFEFVTVSGSNGLKSQTYSVSPKPNSLVIKRDTLDSIRHAIQKYETLPDTTKLYFSRHVDPPEVVPGKANDVGFLILEDLTSMVTLQDELNRVDQGAVSNTHLDRLERATEAICDAVFSLYRATLRDRSHFFGAQLSKLYLSRIETSLTELTHHNKFPLLKPWLTGFMLDNRRFRSVEHYLNKVSGHSGILRVPYLMLVHGDLHSRNIMLDETLQKAKFIDLDQVTYDGDYISDMALLLEDVCIYRFLVDHEYRFRLDLNDVRFPSDSDESSGVDVEYPVLSSEIVRQFQENLLVELKTFASDIDDIYWKERLWLALVSFLFNIAAKQHNVKCAAVAYVEGVKLLDELVSHLSRESSLEGIPFPNQHKGGIRLSSGLKPDYEPAWYRRGDAASELHRALAESEIGLRFKSIGSGAQYFWGTNDKPVAVLNTERNVVLLPCEPNELDDPTELARERTSKSPYRTAVPISMDRVDAIVDLVRQVFD